MGLTSVPMSAAEAERRVAEANRRVAACRAIERRAEEVAQAEQYVAEAERRADEAERRANASIATRPSQPKPTTVPAPTPAHRHTPKEVPVMSAQKLALLRDVENASARLAAARQSLEDAKLLARAGMANNLDFATHVAAGATNEWNRASAAFLSFKG